MKPLLHAGVLAFSLLVPPGLATAATCTPDARPLDGSCNAPSDRGAAGSSFVRVDGYEASRADAPAARTLSSAVVPWARRRLSSHNNAGMTLGS